MVQGLGVRVQGSGLRIREVIERIVVGLYVFSGVMGHRPSDNSGVPV